MKIKLIIFLLIGLGLSASDHLTAQNINSGLIAHYLFNGDVQDNAKHNNHGVMKGGLEFSMDRFGSPCGALSFNGTDAYVVVPHSNSLNSPRRALSVAVWFKLNQGAGSIKWLTVCCKSDIQDELPESPHFRFQTTNQTISINTDFTENFTKDVDFDVWYHYTVTYDGQYVRSYLNGTKFFEFSYSKAFEKNQMPMEIGRDMPGGLEYHSGYLDDLRIYNRGLNDREVMEIYNDQSEKTSFKPCPPTTTTTTTTTTTVTKNPPIVTITQPSTSPFSTSEPEGILIAKIENVKRKKDIKFQVNGVEVKQFSFDKKRQLFKSTIPLNVGFNQCNIYASNNDGSDEDSAIFNYEKPVSTPPIVQKNPPIVTITTPSVSPFATQKSVETLKAKIENIKGKSDIRFVVNGIEVKQFSFDSRSQIFESSVSLNIGFNQCRIFASNNDGKDDDSAIFNYEKTAPPIVTLNPPEVTITLPSAFPATSQVKESEIVAEIKNISAKDQIQFKVNGTPNNNFTFDPATRTFRSLIDLEPGNNFFEITATNQDGKDFQTGTVKFIQNQLPPIITVLTPDTSPYSAPDVNQKIRARIEHVKNKSDIGFTFNTIPDQNFSFDPTSQIFEIDVKLEPGRNFFEITATNQDGRDQAVGLIEYKIESIVATILPNLGKVDVKYEVSLPTDSITIVCFDHKREDGDIVSIIINDQVIASKIELKAKGNGEFRSRLKFLPNKEYILISKAWNTGSSPPNTMTIEFWDEKHLVNKIKLESDLGKSEAVKLIYRQ